MTDTTTVTTHLPPETPLTVANLSQAIAELIAKLPDSPPAKVGDLFTNGGMLAVSI